MTVAYRNGELVEEDVALPPGPGPGLAGGEGLYETMRVDDGRARDMVAHLDRLVEGLTRIGLSIPESREELEAAVDAVASGAPRPVARLRIVVQRREPGEAPHRLVSAVPYEPLGAADYARGVPVIIDDESVIDPDAPTSSIKALARGVYRRALQRAEAAGAFEAFLFNRLGLLAEGSRSNVIVMDESGAVTPPVSDGCLPGTVRRRLLEAGAVRERSVSREGLFAADGVLITSSMMVVVPVSSIDGRSVPVGDHAAELRAALGWTAEAE